MLTKRFYLPSNGSGTSTPPIVPPLSGLWQNGASGAWSLMPEVPNNTPFTSRTVAETVAGSAYAGAYNFVSALLPEDIIITRVRVALQASSGSGSNPTYLAANVRTVKALDLSTAATIFSGHGGGPSAGGFVFVTRELSLITETPVGAGEHLVVETGLYCVNSVATSMGGALKVGDPTAGTDAAVGDTGEKRGWVEITYEPAGFPAYLGSTEVSKLYLGSTEVGAAFLGAAEL